MLLAWNLRIQRRKRRLLFSFVWRSRFGREDWRRVCRCWSIVDLQKRCSEFDMQQRAEGLSCRTFSCEAVLYRPWWLSRAVSMPQKQIHIGSSAFDYVESQKDGGSLLPASCTFVLLLRVAGF